MLLSVGFGVTHGPLKSLPPLAGYHRGHQARGLPDTDSRATTGREGSSPHPGPTVRVKPPGSQGAWEGPSLVMPLVAEQQPGHTWAMKQPPRSGCWLPQDADSRGRLGWDRTISPTTIAHERRNTFRRKCFQGTCHHPRSRWLAVGLPKAD